ncbi:ZIP family metal transporter [Calycomorphotria hydatis]|uniref:Zinc transporter ZupT n=1 Tax=Calycomorphotria hydatis TaxID=2528027 RepID=A0A517T906_9PLAN|nr:ZIP family metal transporter [Calycomorphotria hydatis]QDT64862.1 zinc transporter ZupT [Calycomorphotria hydatis]
MDPWSVAVVYSVLIAVASYFGGSLPAMMRITHTKMQLLMSAVGGLMLGIALFQLLPHALEMVPDNQTVMLWLAAGLLTLFVLIRAFHFHSHEVAVDEPAEEGVPHTHDHDHDHDHGDHHEHHAHSHGHSSARWGGVLIGLSLHSLLDGVALGAAIRSSEGSMIWAASFGTFLAIATHKPLDALSIRSLMQSTGRSPQSQMFVNFLYGIICPLGTVLFLLGADFVGTATMQFTGYALAFSAGMFLCIALSDLLPELEFHSHDRVKLTAALFAGVALAFVVERLSHGVH